MRILCLCGLLMALTVSTLACGSREQAVAPEADPAVAEQLQENQRRMENQMAEHQRQMQERVQPGQAPPQ